MCKVKQFQLTIDMDEKTFGKDCWRMLQMFLNDTRVRLLYQEYDAIDSFNAEFYFAGKQIGMVRVVDMDI